MYYMKNILVATATYVKTSDFASIFDVFLYMIPTGSMALKQHVEPRSQEMTAYYSNTLPKMPDIYMNTLPYILFEQAKT